MKTNKIAYLAIAYMVVIALIIANVGYLMATGKNLYSQGNIQAYAQNRAVKTTPVYSQRGTIYSSDGQIVAQDVTKYKLVVIIDASRPGYGDTPSHLVDYDALINDVSVIIGMEPAKMKEKLQYSKDNNLYQMEFGSYGNSLSAIQKKQIEALDIAGIEFSEVLSRNYPLGDFASYVVGYALNKYVSEDDQKIVGEYGIEKTYNDLLAGVNGYESYQVDTSGYVLPGGIIEDVEPENGDIINLTIDSSLQRDLDTLMEENLSGAGATLGSCVIIEAKTGRILAQSNYPSYNPNDRNIENYTNFLTEYPYEVGSIFKPFVYSYMIDNGLYNGEELYQSGSYQVKTSSGKVTATIRDWNNSGWGMISFNEGLYRSSNTAICNLLSRVPDHDDLVNFYKELGFFQSSQVDGFDITGGIGPNGELTNFYTSGFGQGTTLTLYQLARAYSIFANDGKMITPYWIDSIIDGDSSEVLYSANTEYSNQLISSDTVSKMKDLLYRVTHFEYGTGARYQIDDSEITIIGKTGTGQIAENGGYSSDEYSHSFVGLFPYEDPEIIIAFCYLGEYATGSWPDNIIKGITPAAYNTVHKYQEDTTSIEGMVNTLPSFVNQSTGFATSQIGESKLEAVVVGNGSTVVSQYPTAYTTVNVGDKIFVKTDGNEIAMPDVTGWSRKDISTFASMANISVNIKGDGQVATSQSVAANTVLTSGQSVEVVLGN
ncbi:MAG: penicillin-binding protein [Erysipelotrichaceae bacterium]|nr:penicillin-binding protein [Erysipelotrichaceae bacterium]